MAFWDNGKVSGHITWPHFLLVACGSSRTGSQVPFWLTSAQAIIHNVS
jgi:hypothetical protein